MRTKRIGLKVCALALALLMMAAVIASPGFTEKVYAEDIEINETNFPDANFRSYVKGNINADGNGYLSADEIADVTTISLFRKNIANLKGIEYFTNLETLTCSEDKQLTGVDLSKNTKLKSISCNITGLTSLDLSKNTQLTLVNCSSTGLTSLDLSKNTQLTSLTCSYTALTNLDLSQNTQLTSLTCDSVPLTSLDLCQNTELEKLSCNSTALTSLDLSHNTKLTNLHCDTTQLTGLDLSLCPNLTEIYCSSNSQLTSLTLGDKPSLTGLHCNENQLTSLDLSQCPNLTEIYCSSNSQLTSLTLGDKPSLTGLYCNENQLATLDVSQCSALETLWCHKNQLTNLDVSQSPNLNTLLCFDNSLPSLNVGNNLLLTILNCADNQLTSVDTHLNTNLTALSCNENLLTALDVSSNPLLTELNCYQNQLVSLDLTNNQSLINNLMATNFHLQSRAVQAAYIDGKMVVDLADDLGLDLSRVSDVTVTGGTYSDGKAYFDIPVTSDAKITYNYDTNNSNLDKMDVTLTLSVANITFDTDDGTAIAAQTVGLGEKASKPADPTKDGNHFLGWYTDPAFTDGSEYDFDTPVTADITLYAKFEPHTFGAWVHTGSHTHECTVCGYSETEECTFGEWEITKQPTATEKGEKQRVCSKCGYVEKAEIAATGATSEPDSGQDTNSGSKPDSAGSDSPGTGDNSSAVLWTILMLAAAEAGLLMARRRAER